MLQHVRHHHDIKTRAASQVDMYRVAALYVVERLKPHILQEMLHTMHIRVAQVHTAPQCPMRCIILVIGVTEGPVMKEGLRSGKYSHVSV